MNVTLCPGATVTDDGFTPEPVMVIVAPIVPTLPVLREMTVTGDGPVDPPPPPHETAAQRLPTPSAAVMKRVVNDMGTRVLTMSRGNQKNLREMLKPMNQE